MSTPAPRPRQRQARPEDCEVGDWILAADHPGFSGEKVVVAVGDSESYETTLSQIDATGEDGKKPLPPGGRHFHRETIPVGFGPNTIYRRVQ